MAGDAKHRIGLRIALVCTVGCLLSPATPLNAAADGPESAQVAFDVPIASDVRIAGDDSQTRFILDLDRNIPLRAFALSDPYRVVVDIPQVNFQLPATAPAARGLIKAFRYGLVMPGGSRIVMDLKRPAKIDKAYVIETGRIVMSGTADEIANNEDVRKSYLGY